ncbi:ATP-binding protein [Dyadobacter sp. CY312]|uniref:ATP-binding protein n=1 Tax=Dyadobacter sp. CY312 TaxID=2907303 RepID=UPI001F48540B|nr:ATP-binding protein [Dyadobacter sp. CY312]MCE7041285.1 ATP-binding protein [Dyadobacter sp. CY312]
MSRSLKFLLLYIVGVALILTDCYSQEKIPSQNIAKAGTLDLRNVNLNNQDVGLTGEWKFFWKMSLAPKQVEPKYEYSKFPGLWSDTEWKNEAIPSQGFATYKLTVLLPEQDQQLGLGVPEMYCAYNLFVNGKLLARNGKPGKTKLLTLPYWSNQVIPLASERDTLQILIQIANFQHEKGGASKEIKIGILNNLQAASNLNYATDYFLTGCILMGGFFFLGLYLFGNQDRSILYFSLFCIFYSYRIIGSGQYTLQSIFPHLSWEYTVHFEYLSLFLAVAMFALYTRHLYPEDAPQKILSVMAGICLAFALITLLAPPILFTRLIDPFIFIVVVYIAFAVVIYWRAFRNRRVGSGYALMSSVAIFIIIICVILEYYGIATPFDFVLFVGYAIFFFCQSLILTFRFAYTLKKAKEDAELGLKTKSEFLSTMSHEIRTPLNSVIGMTHLMIRDDPRPDQKGQLEVLLFSANNLLTIVNDVLDFGTIEAGKIRFTLEPTDISLIARNTISGYQAAANNSDINFILDIDEHLPTHVLGDKTRTAQIMGNLVHNATKFTNKGHVKLSVHTVKKTQEEITLKISVEDTGIGIPLDKQKVIFERFTQADSSTSRGFGGTGLGLAISKKLLEIQGVDLNLTSEPGKGSTFYFVQTFPILVEPEITPKIENKSPQKLSGIRILIVEDNEMNILVLQNFLKRWGASFDIARNGQEAIDMLNESHQLILMDMHMPVMDGYEASKVLRSRGETIPIIALTAGVAVDIEDSIYEIGITDIVVKPFIPESLLKVVLQHLKA